VNEEPGDLSLIIGDYAEGVRDLVGRIYKHPTRLSAEQVIFCLELLNNGYQVPDAVRKTFGKTVLDWTPSRCAALGHTLLRLPKVREYLQEQIDNRINKLQITLDWVANKYKAWSEIDIARYISLEQDDRGKPYIKLKTDLHLLPINVRTAIKGISVTAKGDVKLEFIDQKSALDSLAKLMGFIDSKIQIESKAPIILNFDKQDAGA
jgi:hypothetical protein